MATHYVTENYIDPEDPIEKLIRKSIALCEEAFRRRKDGIGPIEKIEALEKEGEELWAEAKRLGKPHVQKSNYEDLANAYLMSCVHDYEDLISGGAEGPKKNKELIEDILEHQMFVKTDMTEMLRKIDRIYKNEFVPYVKEHYSDIINEWKMFEKTRRSIKDCSRDASYRCPLCKGALRPKYLYNSHKRTKNIEKIICTGCGLSSF